MVATRPRGTSGRGLPQPEGYRAFIEAHLHGTRP